MQRNFASWFEIYVEDMERAKKFYEAVLQVELQSLENPEIEMWMFPGGPEMAGANGSLVKMEGVRPGGNSTLVYFGCADCAVEAGAGRAGWWEGLETEAIYLAVRFHRSCSCYRRKHDWPAFDGVTSR